MKKYWTVDREAGNLIEAFYTYEEAQKAILAYEDQDKADGIFEENFYDIVSYEDREHIEAPRKRYYVKIGEMSRKNGEFMSNFESEEFYSYVEALKHYKAIDLAMATARLCAADRETFYFEKSLACDLLDEDGELCNEYEILECESCQVL